jgi:hypothetical protein
VGQCRGQTMGGMIRGGQDMGGRIWEDGIYRAGAGC